MSCLRLFAKMGQAYMQFGAGGTFGKQILSNEQEIDKPVEAGDVK